jgi:hypothetical protein
MLTRNRGRSGRMCDAADRRQQSTRGPKTNLEIPAYICILSQHTIARGRKQGLCHLARVRAFLFVVTQPPLSQRLTPMPA